MLFRIVNLLCLVAFLQCSTAHEDENSVDALANALTLEVTIGDENVINEDFLLARPYSMAVNDAGDMIVLDEDRLKVYSATGQEKSIIADKGEGPGELQYSGVITMGVDGFFTVRDGKGMNFFDPQNNYIKTIRRNDTPKFEEELKDKNARLSSVGKSIPIDLAKTVSQYSAYSMDSSRKRYNLLVYERDGVYDHIAFMEDKTSVRAKNISFGFQHRGTLLWRLYGKNKVVYWYPSYEDLTEKEDLQYTLNIFDLTNSEESQIHHPFTLAFLSDSTKSMYDRIEWDENMIKQFGSEIKEVSGIMKQEKHYAPIKSIQVDKNILYVVTNLKNEKEEYFVDVFDLSKNKYLRSAYFSVEPTVIKDGYAYYIKRGQEILPEIEKYKIDPKVYQK